MVLESLHTSRNSNVMHSVERLNFDLLLNWFAIVSIPAEFTERFLTVLRIQLPSDSAISEKETLLLLGDKNFVFNGTEQLAVMIRAKACER